MGWGGFLAFIIFLLLIMYFIIQVPNLMDSWEGVKLAEKDLKDSEKRIEHYNKEVDRLEKLIKDLED
jgi:cell division protein FtsB